MIGERSPPLSLTCCRPNRIGLTFLTTPQPDFVAPLVGYLVHPSVFETAGIYESSVGWSAKVRVQRSGGYTFPVPHTPEDIKAHWKEINGMLCFESCAIVAGDPARPGSTGCLGTHADRFFSITDFDDGRVEYPTSMVHVREAMLRSTYYNRGLNDSKKAKL